MSHPMWVRGLKLYQGPAEAGRYRSHPMWVRGLKHSHTHHSLQPMYVAPHVGAWIETSQLNNTIFERKSHPMWVRGLKLAEP